MVVVFVCWEGGLRRESRVHPSQCSRDEHMGCLFCWVSSGFKSFRSTFIGECGLFWLSVWLLRSIVSSLTSSHKDAIVPEREVRGKAAANLEGTDPRRDLVTIFLKCQGPRPTSHRVGRPQDPPTRPDPTSGQVVSITGHGVPVPSGL